MPAMSHNSRTPSIRPAPAITTGMKLAALLNAHDHYTEDEHHPTSSRPPPTTTSCTSSPGPNMSAYSSPAAATPSPRHHHYAVDLAMFSPWNNLPPSSPYAKSPWTIHAPPTPYCDGNRNSVLVGSLVREEGHVYSLAASEGLLYTGSESKNVRVWCRSQEFSGFKSASGLVKAIVVTQSCPPRLSSSSSPGKAAAGRRVFTGHQDGKIRVWASSVSSSSTASAREHRRVGSLPRLRDVLRGSLLPANYVRVRRGRSALWMRHQDAVSCLCVSGDDGGLLYSGSWDKTVKVWRLADSRCLESIAAHDDAVNAVAASPPGMFLRGRKEEDRRRSLLFTGSADGTVKAWRRRDAGIGGPKEHVLVQTLLRVDCAVTSLAVSAGNPHAGVLPALYSGSSDGMVNFWVSGGSKMEGAATELLAHAGTLHGHRLAVLCVVAAGSSLVLSGSADRTICVWRREAEGGVVHSCLTVLNGHQGPVKCLAVEAEEKQEQEDQQQITTWFVYSGSLDKSVKVWKVSNSASGDMGPRRDRLGHSRNSPLLQR